VANKVHLVGSVGLEDVDAVFEAASATLGGLLARIPDGEPGGRRLWISWQYPVLRAHPLLQVDANNLQKASAGLPKLRLADGVSPDQLNFGELGYAREARASSQDFLRARAAGKIGQDIRFQVCLPTPLAVIDAFCAKDAVLEIEPAYEAAMCREVAKICAEIPLDDLSLQWDLCVEMILWDGRSTFYSRVVDKSGILERANRLCRDLSWSRMPVIRSPTSTSRSRSNVTTMRSLLRSEHSPSRRVANSISGLCTQKTERRAP
jgi:hypothetical protein